MRNSVFIIPVWDTVSATWEKVYGAKATIWKAIALLLAIMFCFGFIEGIIKAVNPGFSGIAKLMGNIIGYLLWTGVQYIGIKRASNQPITFRLIFRSFDTNIAMKLFGVYILLVLLCMLSLLPLGLFIIPLPPTIGAHLTAYSHALLLLIMIPLFFCGIILLFLPLYIAVRLQLANALVLDQAMGSWQAIKTSWQMTRSNFWHLLGLNLIQFVFITAGFISLGIGLIWMLPFSAVCYGLIYKNLLVNNK